VCHGGKKGIGVAVLDRPRRQESGLRHAVRDSGIDYWRRLSISVRPDQGAMADG
jgi:hypothetical protein